MRHLERCKAGHFYDADKYISCPYCRGSEKEDATIAFGSEKSHAISLPAAIQEEDEKPEAGEEHTMSLKEAVREAVLGTGRTVECCESEPVETQGKYKNEEVNKDEKAAASKSEEEPEAECTGSAEESGKEETGIIHKEADETNKTDRSKNTEVIEETVEMEIVKTEEKQVDEKNGSERSERVEKPERPMKNAGQGIRNEPVVGWLVCTEGCHYGKSFELRPKRNFIGRGDENDVVLAGDPSVSEYRHTIVIYDPRSRNFIVQQGDSRELSYLNGALLLNSEMLKAYDILSVGDEQLLFIPMCGEAFSWEDNKRIEAVG